MDTSSVGQCGGYMVGPKVLVISLPKSGTHVINSTLAQIPGMSRCRHLWLNSKMPYHPLNWLPYTSRETCMMGIHRPQRVRLSAARFSLARLKPWQYGSGHIPYQDNIQALIQEYGICALAVIRDPRDVVVSSVFYAKTHKSHFLKDAINARQSFRDQVKMIIEGGVTERGIPFMGIADQLDMIEGWVAEPSVLTVRFEEIIGTRGGGDMSDQNDTITTLCEFIGLRITREEAKRIGSEMFGKGRTFRKGVIGGWKDYFDDEICEIFDRRIGHRLERFGYS